MDERVYLREKFKLISLSLKYDAYKEATIEILKTLKNLGNPNYIYFAESLLANINQEVPDVDTYMRNKMQEDEENSNLETLSSE